jgi:hypothetical protein
MIKAVKNNGKGKRPTIGTLKLEGRNAYGSRHIAFIMEANNGIQFHLLSVDIESAAEFAAAWKAALAQAKVAPDTTPAGKSAPQPTQSTQTAAASDDLENIANIIQTMLAKIETLEKVSTKNRSKKV